MKMERLTCKPDKVMENYYYETTEKTKKEDRIVILNKLGRLEDIEDELGIDLITLLNEHPYAKHLLYNLIRNIPFVFAPKQEDYGKTWALTKQELE